MAISVDEQLQILKNLLSELELKEESFRQPTLGQSSNPYADEFLKIRLISESLPEHEAYKAVVAWASVNQSKNRYIDIIPYDYSRVVLPPSKYGADEEETDYINASFINGANGHVAYIAAQSPTGATVRDFWRMILEFKVKAVVMLCDVIESGKEACACYWPTEQQEIDYGDVRITLESEWRHNNELTVRNLSVALPEGMRRRIYQLHYLGWPDHGVPQSVDSLLELVKTLRKYQPTDAQPIVVHCRAGCGRTGTLCAIDYTRSLIKSGNLPPEFSVFDLVVTLRQQRIAMVQTLGQYMILHGAIRKMLGEHLRLLTEGETDDFATSFLLKARRPLLRNKMLRRTHSDFEGFAISKEPDTQSLSVAPKRPLSLIIQSSHSPEPFRLSMPIGDLQFEPICEKQLHEDARGEDAEVTAILTPAADYVPRTRRISSTRPSTKPPPVPARRSSRQESVTEEPVSNTTLMMPVVENKAPLQKTKNSSFDEASAYFTDDKPEVIITAGNFRIFGYPFHSQKKPKGPVKEPENWD